MKPRLKSLPLTDEDMNVWLFRFARPETDTSDDSAWVKCLDSDRRDADLMLALATYAVRGTCYQRIKTQDGYDSLAVPAVQVWVYKNPLFPEGNWAELLDITYFA